LPDNQEQLLEAVVATGKPIILVLENGRPLTIPWAKEHVPAILEAWYPGEFGGQAIAETLFGDNNPAGRLSVSFPRNLGQLPDFYNTDPSRKRKYVDDDGEALFPFGFGLSYTTFRYAHLLVQAPSASLHDPVRVSVEVTNTGEREGDEVAQLYLRQDTSSVETPVRSLKGFSRIHLKPHESRTLTFDVPRSELAIWNAEGRWVTEPGAFTVWIGGNSRADLAAHFTLKL
jgi:beta-glucosidase